MVYLPWTKKAGPPASNWVLRTALGLASLAKQSAVRSTGAQHRGTALGK
jgi:hypothetical protein